MTYQTRVKICGITSITDANLALRLGADAIGLVFYDKSPRCVDLEAAYQIARSVGPFVSVVGLFVNPDANFVRQVMNAVPLNLLQFHGDEDAAFCKQFSLPYLKAVKVPLPNEDNDSSVKVIQEQVLNAAAAHANAAGILLDTLHEKYHGGTGLKFDWRCVPQTQTTHWVLAGGLNADNVQQAIQQVKPYAVDVSSGVEQEPGTKDKVKLHTFIQAAKQAN